MPSPITLDLETLTLGQMMDIELASGRKFTELVQSPVGLTMVAMYLQALQKHADDISQLDKGETRPPAPTWKAMERLTPSAALRFVSREQADSD